MGTDGCTLYSQNSSCIGCVFIEKGSALTEHLSAGIFGLGGGRSYNLVLMHSISGAMNEYSCSYTHLSICL